MVISFQFIIPIPLLNWTLFWNFIVFGELVNLNIILYDSVNSLEMSQSLSIAGKLPWPDANTLSKFSKSLLLSIIVVVNFTKVFPA